MDECGIAKILLTSYALLQALLHGAGNPRSGRSGTRDKADKRSGGWYRSRRTLESSPWLGALARVVRGNARLGHPKVVLWLAGSLSSTMGIGA